MGKELTDEQWELIAPHLPPPKRMGRPRTDDRRTLERILWVLRAGARWQDLPREFGSSYHLLAPVKGVVGGRGGLGDPL